MNSYHATREREDADHRFAAMADALLCRLRGTRPEGLATLFERCSLRDFEILCAASDRGVTLSGNTIDFPTWTSTVLEKRALDHYRLIAAPVLRLTKSVSSRSFRPSTTLTLDFPALERVPEHAEVRAGVLAETGELLALESWAKIVALSRQVILADNIHAVDDLAQQAASAAVTALNDLFFTALLAGSGAGPTLRDGLPLFHANHGNLMIAAELNTTSLGIAVAALRSQRSVSGSAVNLAARYLLVGPSQEVAARALLFSLGSPLELAVDSHLGGEFYVFADPASRPAFVRAQLGDGGGAPGIVARRGFTIDGLEFRCMADFGIGPADWRPIIRTPFGG